MVAVCTTAGFNPWSPAQALPTLSFQSVAGNAGSATALGDDAVGHGVGDVGSV